MGECRIGFRMRRAHRRPLRWLAGADERRAEADPSGTTALGAHRRHPTSNRAGYAFHLSETARANTQNGWDRERPEHQRAGGFFIARDSPAFLSRRVLFSDRSTRRTNRGRETMRDDPWTAANRDKEQQKVIIPPRRKPTAETASPPSKPTVSGPFWTGKTSAHEVPKPQRVVDARQRTDD